MKKKFICIFLILEILLTGCQDSSSQNAITESNIIPEGVGLSDTCAVYVGLDKLLHFYDVNQKTDVILCNKADCKHEKYDEQMNPDPVCEAALNNKLFFNCTPILSGEYIYLIGEESLKQGGVYRERRDGSERKKMYNIDFQIYPFDNIYVKNGFVYATAHIPLVYEDKMGGSGSNNCYDVFVKLNLETGECKQISQVKKTESQSLRILNIQGNIIFYEFSYMPNGEKISADNYEDEDSMIYSYNLASEEVKLLFNEKELAGYEILGVGNDALCVVNRKNKEAVELSLQNKKEKVIYKTSDYKNTMYFVYEGKWIVEDMEKEKSYYLSPELKELVNVSGVVRTAGKYIEFWDKSGKDRVMSGKDFWEQTDNIFFERKAE